MDIDDAFSRCVIRLLYREPFFGHLLVGVIRRFDDHVPTAAVGVSHGRATIYVNPYFFLHELADESEQIAVVKHEVLHLVFKHPALERMANRHRRVWNIATDLVVNQFVGGSLPASAVTLSSFPDLDLPADGTADAYYERLLALCHELERTGDPLQTGAPQSAETLAKIGTWHSHHGLWEESDETASIAIDDLVSGVASRVGVKGIGSLPGRLRDVIDEILGSRRATVDWRRVVRIFSQSSRHTKLAPTHRRPSRRFGSFPGVRVRRCARLAVAIDTSGSISREMLASFFAELHGVWLQGTEVHVIECDAAVQRVYRYTGRLPEFALGRGGTSVDPVFEWLRADRQSAWDGCIYLTDGDFAPPQTKPPCPLLWALTPDAQPGDQLRFGRVVRLRND